MIDLGTLLQNQVDAMNAEEQKTRAETQMTLGGLISALEKLPARTVITGLGELDSYRGYYCDLAFEPASDSEAAGELLARCRDAMGRVYEGYKGGEYFMEETTPLWVAYYGSCGERFIEINEDGTVTTAEDEG